MKKLNICLVGFGRFGKIYFNEILKNKKINHILILKKNKFQNKPQEYKNIKFAQISKKLSLDNIQYGIIATPVLEHYDNASMFLKKKIPIILEKPVSDKLSNIEKLNVISQKKKISVIVNYSDLYNDYFKYLLRNRHRLGKIVKIEMFFQGRLNIYNNSLPILDYVPHFFAIANKIINTNGSFNLIRNQITKKNDCIYQNIIFTLTNKKNQIIKFNYSNKSSNKKKRQIIIFGKKGMFKYDAYENNKNFIKIKKKVLINNILNKKINTPIQNILNRLHYLVVKKKFYNDLPLSIKIQKMTNKLIEKF